MNTLKRTYDFLGGEVLLFDKSPEWTSFDLVQKVRNALCRKMGIKKMKVGHAGTLDPLASGLMIICTGKATKMIESFQKQEKEYLATLKLGATTPSFDLETPEDRSYPYNHVTGELLHKTLEKFHGEILQVPPLYSAVKIKGERAYSYARKGEELKLDPKKIVVQKIIAESFDPPFVTLRIKCSKGTYIRSLARDIGKELKCGAYLTKLRRMKIGEFKIENSLTIDRFLKNLNNYVTN